MNVPIEIIYKILIHTSPDEIIELCKLDLDVFLDICNDNIFWKDKLEYDFPELYPYVLKFLQSTDETYKNYYFDIQIWRRLIVENYPEFLSKADDYFASSGSYRQYYKYIDNNVFTIPVYVFTLVRKSNTGFSSLLRNKLGDINILPSDTYIEVDNRIFDKFDINPQEYNINHYLQNHFTNVILTNKVDRLLNMIELKEKRIYAY